MPDDAVVAEQNDRLRRAAPHLAIGLSAMEELRDRLLFTRAVNAHGPLFPLRCLQMIAAHDIFDPENDPDGHREFGAVEVQEETVWLKINLHADETLKSGSKRPDDPEPTYRVLTVIFPSDW
ncbi:DUF3768 domain-containing protein [Jannaschia sp.]|nr:DUF3768 domain-containing protein [Jannaschia sp.]